VNPEKIDVNKHAFYILGRVLEYGDTDAAKHVRKFYGDRMIRDFWVSTSSRVLSNCTMKRWQAILNDQARQLEKVREFFEKEAKNLAP